MTEITITSDELNNPEIDLIVENERLIKKNFDSEFVEDMKVPFWYSPLFYYSVATTIFAFISWTITEPFISDYDESGWSIISDYLVFGPTAGGIGFALGSVYGFVNRNWRQALYCSFVGMGVGFGATIVSNFLGSIVFGVMSQLAISLSDQNLLMLENEFPFKGIPFIIFMCGRGIAWAIVAMGAGLALGIALKSKKLLINGLVGGMVGGLLGGLFFDLISRFISGVEAEGDLSRMIGITAVGLLTGLFIGFFESVSKESWLQMIKGPLTGKQFIIFKSPLIIGSSPKSDIYLFKDAAIEPKHAEIIVNGNRNTLKAMSPSNDVYVNGQKIEKRVLQQGDTITIGETVLKFGNKE
jgi:hypothetical protein